MTKAAVQGRFQEGGRGWQLAAPRALALPPAAPIFGWTSLWFPMMKWTKSNAFRTLTQRPMINDWHWPQGPQWIKGVWWPCPDRVWPARQYNLSKCKFCIFVYAILLEPCPLLWPAEKNSHRAKNATLEKLPQLFCIFLCYIDKKTTQLML